MSLLPHAGNAVEVVTRLVAAACGRHAGGAAGGGSTAAAPTPLLPRIRPLLFLDYDGTLAAIVSDPDRAVLTPAAAAVLAGTAARFTTTIVSGRAVDRVAAFTGLPPLPPTDATGYGSSSGGHPHPLYAGSHGCDIRGGPLLTRLVAAPFLPALAAARDALTASLVTGTGTGSDGLGGARPIPGVTVEDNVVSVSLHYRNVVGGESAQQAVIDRVAAYLHQQQQQQAHQASQQQHYGLLMRPGKMVVELRPAVDWHKGRAMEWILQRYGLLHTQQPQQHAANTTAVAASEPVDEVVLLVVIGDDMTDEDMMAAAVRAAAHSSHYHSQKRIVALTILVAEPVQEGAAAATAATAAVGSSSGGLARMPRTTAAQWWLRDPGEVQTFLQQLLEAGKSGVLSTGWLPYPAAPTPAAADDEEAAAGHGG